METKEEFISELYSETKSNLKFKRLIIEFLFIVPITVAISALMFCYFLNIFFIFLPLFLVPLFLYLGIKGKTLTPISGEKIEKEILGVLVLKEKKLSKAIRDTQEKIKLAKNNLERFEHEKMLIEKIKKNFS